MLQLLGSGPELGLEPVRGLISVQQLASQVSGSGLELEPEHVRGLIAEQLLAFQFFRPGIRVGVGNGVIDMSSGEPY